MLYLRWFDESLHKVGIDRLLLELDRDGRVLRELGFDAAGRIVHKCPDDKFEHGTHGLFDLARFDVSGLTSDLDKEEFERFWRTPTDASGGS